MKVSAKSKELIALDAKFSKYIIERDRRCVFPGCGRTDTLTCSHYEPRARWATRWHTLNCDCLCMKHHRLWETDPDLQYTAFKAGQLGEGVLLQLIALAKSGMKRAEAMEEAKTFLGLQTL